MRRTAQRPATLSPGLLLLLAAIGALGSMAIHMFVPAIPSVARDLRAEPGTIQLAVTLYLIGVGAGQLAAGTLADGLGRRPVMLAGLVLFVAGSIAAALAQHAAVLLAARLAQSFGGAAGIVAARTMVSDLTDRRDVAARLATLMTVLLVSPAIAPVIGGAIAAHGGWRIIFVVLAVAGLLGVLASFLVLGETRVAQPRGAQPQLLHSYARLLRNPRFCRYSLANACCSCALYIFLAGSAFLLIGQYGLRPEQAGLCYFLVAVSSIAGTFVVGALERRGGALRIGLGTALAGGTAMLALASTGYDGVAALMGPMLVIGFGGGVAAPAGMAGAMHAEEGLAGTGSSLAGALQMLASGLTTSLIAQFGLASLGSLACGIFFSALIGFAAAPRGRAISGA